MTIITISGTPGSGKSTVAKILITKLSAERIYVGGIRRQIARDKGMSISELNEYAITHPETDVDVDEQAAAEAKKLESKGKVVIVEGRTQFHFLPQSIKIYMKVNPDKGAERIWNELKNKDSRAEEQASSLTELKQELVQREEVDAQRYQKYYKIDHHDEQNYDLVVDTTKLTAEEAAKKIIKFVKRYEEK